MKSFCIRRTCESAKNKNKKKNNKLLKPMTKNINYYRKEYFIAKINELS